MQKKLISTHSSSWKELLKVYQVFGVWLVGCIVRPTLY